MIANNRFAALMDVQDDDDDNPDVITKPVYETSPTMLSTDWRNSPLPTGPWRHPSVRPQRDATEHNGDHTNTTIPAQSNPSDTTNRHQAQPTFTPFNPSPSPVLPPYGFTPLQTFDMSEFNIINSAQYCATLNNMNNRTNMAANL